MTVDARQWWEVAVLRNLEAMAENYPPGSEWLLVVKQQAELFADPLWQALLDRRDRGESFARAIKGELLMRGAVPTRLF